jgi:hypothetical protein
MERSECSRRSLSEHASTALSEHASTLRRSAQDARCRHQHSRGRLPYVLSAKICVNLRPEKICQSTSRRDIQPMAVSSALAAITCGFPPWLLRARALFSGCPGAQKGHSQRALAVSLRKEGNRPHYTTVCPNSQVFRPPIFRCFLDLFRGDRLRLRGLLSLTGQAGRSTERPACAATGS